MTLPFSTIAILWLLPLALLPFVATMWRRSPCASLDMVPPDSLSAVLAAILKLVQCVAIAGPIIALAGPYRVGALVAKSVSEAQIVLLLDRSTSMDMAFDDTQTVAPDTAKRSVAARMLDDFVAQTDRDRFGIVAFSAMPAVAAPVTASKDVARAAIRAMDRTGIDGTNIGLALAAGLDLLAEAPDLTAPAVVLVSDGQFGGAGHFDHRMVDRLKASFRRHDVRLFWLFVRPQSARSVFDPPSLGEPDNPFTKPERHMDLFFKSIGVPYQLLQVGDAKEMTDALVTIRNLAARPASYAEPIPRLDQSGLFYALSTMAALLLLAAKLVETRLGCDQALVAGFVQKATLRDPRFWLVGCASALLIGALLHPTVARTRNVYDVIATVDITRSMNVRDLTEEGRPTSRLDAIKANLGRLLAAMPCGSRMGLALFSERQSFLMFEPVEICANFAAIDGAVRGLTWRMAWSGDSYISRGLFSAIDLAGSGKANVLFLTDGHEAPPLPDAGGPRFPGQPGDVKGLVVGVGGERLSPIPKFDDRGHEVGFLASTDVDQTNKTGLRTKSVTELMEEAAARADPSTPVRPEGQEHLTSIRRVYLKALARETGLEYSDLAPPGGLAAALQASAKPRHVLVAVDLRPWLATGALFALLAAFAPLPAYAKLVRGPGLVPTNDGCERPLRPAVVQRKVTNGHRAMWGRKRS